MDSSNQTCYELFFVLTSSRYAVSAFIVRNSSFHRDAY